MQRKEIQCCLQADGSLAPAPAGQMGDSVATVTQTQDPVMGVQGNVMLGGMCVAFLSYDFTGQRVVGYTPTTSSPVILESLNRLFPLF